MKRPEGVDATTQSPETQTTEDKEVAAWVIDRLGLRKRGLLQDEKKPALHAVALDNFPGNPLLDDPAGYPGSVSQEG